MVEKRPRDLASRRAGINGPCPTCSGHKPAYYCTDCVYEARGSSHKVTCSEVVKMIEALIDDRLTEDRNPIAVLKQLREQVLEASKQ